VERLYVFPKVTIAALNGAAVGAAANVALACDIVVAARSAYLQQAFAKIALVPDAGGTWLLPRIVGAKRALALMLTADQVPAADLHAMGLVYKVFDDAVFGDEVEALARRFAAGPALAYRLIKQLARVSEGQRPENPARARGQPAAPDRRERGCGRGCRGVPRETGRPLSGAMT